MAELSSKKRPFPNIKSLLPRRVGERGGSPACAPGAPRRTVRLVLPFIGSLTPSTQKRPKKQLTYPYHMVPRAGGSAHCQPRTPSAPPLPVGYCNHGDQQVPPYHRRASQPRAQALGEAEGSLQQKGSAPFTENCGELMETD